jgi:hypothetical protein
LLSAQYKERGCRLSAGANVINHEGAPISHKFIPVYWKNYVRQVLNAWTSKDDNEMEIDSEKVMLWNQEGKVIGRSTVHDYMYRPACYEDVSLYEWVQCAKRVKINVQDEHDTIHS